MNKALRLGDFNRLRVVKEVDFGIYLDGGDGEEILMPQRYVPQHTRIGDEVEAFLYLDQEERLVATTEKPLAKVGDFACLEVSWVNEFGAFLHWGLMKDLFCPFREQKKRMEKGLSYIVYITIDPDSYRIMASAKVEHFLDKEPATYVKGNEVELLVWQKTDLGFKVIIDNRYAGLVYDNMVFRPLRTGDRLKGYIMQVREDGKIDVTLQPEGRQQTTDFAETLLRYLQSSGGYCDLGDKSDAQDIRDRFEVSKKVFKKAVGDLYKRRLIEPGDESIRLINDPPKP
ncbi:MAG: S1-like domain-containing RNA-binding protein [Prevotellaceae bacterium]|nr:S1-like domain-containing RNA-binding protein [Prevotellaceae bacterium]